MALEAQIFNRSVARYTVPGPIRHSGRLLLALLSLVSGARLAHAADVTVQVLAKEAGQPITAASVCLGTRADPSQFGAQLTGPEGMVVFHGVPDAPLVLTVSKAGRSGDQQALFGGRSDQILNVSLARGGTGPVCRGASAPPAPVLALTGLRLDGGAAVTEHRRVTLDFSLTGTANQYRASESPQFTGARWATLHPRPGFELSAGPGEKQVYLQVRQFRERHGSTLEVRSNVVSGAIRYQPR
ncbi:MAG TPA: carboxypeptidase regulatory-like domain-containing protein [Gammaproteobacteria bacterium]|nr:carboxypeptidase regulatory-like domain-containing protein [Gammaproteobacteria bacterium]